MWWESKNLRKATAYGNQSLLSLTTRPYSWKQLKVFQTLEEQYWVIISPVSSSSGIYLNEKEIICGPTLTLKLLLFNWYPLTQLILKSKNICNEWLSILWFIVSFTKKNYKYIEIKSKMPKKLYKYLTAAQ